MIYSIKFFFILLILIQLQQFNLQESLSNKISPSKSNITNSIRSIALSPNVSKLSRLVGSGSLLMHSPKQLVKAQAPRIQYESYKALVGETVRLECPQPNPTWFYRKFNNNPADLLNTNNNEAEDLIVTRHGIINADYKYKIMCHLTLKHKVIIINNIDFDEEGLYTCLYTMPTGSGSNDGKPPSLSSYYSNNAESNFYSNDGTGNPVQYRYVFNVTVYSKLIYDLIFYL
jgi:hypothetical protein